MGMWIKPFIRYCNDYYIACIAIKAKIGLIAYIFSILFNFVLNEAFGWGSFVEYFAVINKVTVY